MQHAAALSHQLDTTTGQDHRKMLMWAFLGSDCMFFGSLIANFLVNKGRAVAGPTSNVLDIPYTSVSAFVLLMSSLTMVLALAAIQRGDLRRMQIWLVATASLGAVFLGGQYFEFTSFVHEGLGLNVNIYGSSFFVLTGFHGTHVGIGVIWLMSLVLASTQGLLSQQNSLWVEIAGLYWHFVDVVWIVIFTLVYLLGT